MKKILCMLLTLSFVLCLLITLPFGASAATEHIRHGLEVSIITDKYSYGADETIQLSIEIKNTNPYRVDGLALETFIPEGLKVEGENLHLESFSIEAGETFSSETYTVQPLPLAGVQIENVVVENQVQNNAPTVDSAFEKETVTEGALSPLLITLVIVGILAALALALFFVLKHKKAARVMSVLLCVTMLFSVVPMYASAFGGVKEVAKVDKTILVDGKAQTLRASLIFPDSYIDPNCRLVFDTKGGSEINPQYMLRGDTPHTPSTPYKEECIFLGWYTNDTYTEEFDFSKPLKKSDKAVALWLDISDPTDTDGDGLSDVIEEYMGLDPYDADTDGDGLDDYVESNLLSYNPKSRDTDGDGVYDGSEDCDGDGITNLSEISIGTSPAAEDTDLDGLTDPDEIDVYNTSPVLADTDGDGVSDGKEIELGTDPFTHQSSFAMNLSAEESEDSVTASVAIELAGEQVETLKIEPVENTTFFPATMPGYLGKAYDFSVDGGFESATIGFEFDTSMLTPDSDPVICYFNEETQMLEELETEINGNVASATVTHFSKYILIDRTVYEESFAWVDVWDSSKTYSGAEIILVIDDSGSLGGDYGYNSSTGTFTGGQDPTHQRLTVARDFVDSANEKTKIGIVKFDGVVDDISGGLVECTPEGKAQLKNHLQFTYKSSGEYNMHGIFDSRGTTYMYEGIQNAIGKFSSSEDDVMKVIIVFTDGQAHDTGKHNSTINSANANDVKIYTVGLGTSSLSSYFDNYLKPLANQTDGAFYVASNASQLSQIYDNISQKIDIETDSDEDGIPDYYEDHMVPFNGVEMKLDKNKKDSDEDGIPDNEEIELTYEYNEDETKVKVTGRILRGNPAVADTDGDGYLDGEDPNPFTWNVSDRDLAMCANIAYCDLPAGTSLANLPKDALDQLAADFGDAASIKELSRWTIVGSWYSLFDMQALAFKVDNSIVLAYRGSQEIFDWVNDASTYLNGLNFQAPAAKSVAVMVVNTYRNSDIYITGHSLGGNLAYNGAAAAILFRRSAVKGVSVFNALGLGGLAITADFKDLSESIILMSARSIIKNYSVDGDPVSRGFLGFTTFHYGVMYPIALHPNAKDAHNLYNFHAVLQPIKRYKRIIQDEELNAQ